MSLDSKKHLDRKKEEEQICQDSGHHLISSDCSCDNGCHQHQDDQDDHDHYGCACGHGHGHGEGIEKLAIIKLGIGGLIFAAAMILSHIDTVLSPYALFGMFAVSYIVVGYEVLFTAIKNIFRGKVFDENFLMAIATIGAFLIGEYAEGVAVMLFYQVGELFQDYAVGKSRESITKLMNIRPDYANLKQNGQIIRVAPETVAIGQEIIIKAGEKIPLDGIVLEGTAAIDTSALTGESLPREVGPGSEVLSACINENGLLTVKVTKTFGESTVSKILDLVENAQEKKAQTENFITRFARYYTPVVVFLALAIAIVPPLVISGAVFGDWIYRGLLFLVISCPCALVISIPLGFFGGIGGASKCGVLIKGGNFLEALSKTEIVAFDKTGTLTKGVFKVKELLPAEGTNREELLKYCAYAESFSNHPIARSIVREYGTEIQQDLITKNKEIAGYGMKIQMDGAAIVAGNYKLMESQGIMGVVTAGIGTCVHVAKDGVYLGAILVGDEIKPNTKEALTALKHQGIKKTVMLTGDTIAAAKPIAEELGIDQFYGELLPGDKVERVEALLREKSPKAALAFVGDGINDAPVLARADIGIAMGGLGSDAAIEAADIVLMTDEVSKLVMAKKLSVKAMRIIKQNIVFAIGIKVLMLALGAFGLATMWGAVFADVGVAVIAILNAMRTLRVKDL